MPTYQYECTKCKHSLEEIQKITDKNLVKCPKCKKNTLARVLFASGIILKGSGWTR